MTSEAKSITEPSVINETADATNEAFRAASETTDTLNAAFRSAQSAVAKANSAITRLDGEIDRLKEKINELNYAPPSMNEVVDYVVGTLRQHGEVWRNGAISAIRRSATPGAMVPMSRITSINDNGHENWEKSRQYPVNILAYHGEPSDLHGSLREDRPIQPFLLAGLLGDLLVPRVEAWLREACADAFPEEPIMPLTERPAAIESLREQIAFLGTKRLEMEQQLSSLITIRAPVARGPSVTQIG